VAGDKEIDAAVCWIWHAGLSGAKRTGADLKLFPTNGKISKAIRPAELFFIQRYESTLFDFRIGGKNFLGEHVALKFPEISA
jgi:hypothetical protein